MAVQVKVTGMENVEKLMNEAELKLLEVRLLLENINAAIRSIGMEINQPEDDTNG